MPAPILGGSGVGRFMESLLGLMITHWDHEPRPGGRWSASVLDCGSPLPLLRPCTRFESARGLAHSKTWRRGVRFMESAPPVLELSCALSGPTQIPAAYRSRGNYSLEFCFAPGGSRFKPTD